MSARRWSAILGWILDLIALGTLAATMEIPTAALAAIPLALAIRRVERLRPSDFGMLLLLGSVVAAGLISWIYLKYPPIMTVACIAPVFHAALWLAPENSTYKGWRIGMGFVDLILASALTSEAFLSAAICLFVVLGSIALACNFLERKIGESPIPASFIRSSALIALLVFPISAVIFPFLPRMSDGARMGFGATETHVGYSEEVSLSAWSHLTEERGSKPVLWLYPESKVDLASEMYHGLLRGRTLELFDSVRWKPATGRFVPTGEPASSPRSTRNLSRSINVDVVLDSLGSSVLPTPYGTYAIASSSEDAPFSIRRIRSGEWLGDHLEGRIRYSFLFSPSLYWFDRSAMDRDLPIPEIHLQVPDELNNERMKNLARTIFVSARTEREKINRLLDYFRQQNFQATLNDSDGATKLNGATKLEHFLFSSRRGHCEWFASATAVLLRISGVPTRLVAGFRLQQRSSDEGGAVVVRGNDAHAWVEAYSSERGWIPVDPTPRILKTSSLMNTILDGYDTVSAFWFRYVLTYSSRSGQSWRSQLFRPAQFSGALSGFRARIHREFSSHWQAIGMAVVLGLSLTIAIYFWIRWKFPWIFSIRYRVREGSPSLRRERLLMEKWAKKQRVEGDLFNAELSPAARKWKELYLKTRFGGPRDGKAESAALAELRKLRREAETLHQPPPVC